MGTKVQGHAAQAPGYPGRSNFLSELHLVQRTYGAKIKKIYFRVFEKIDFVETRFRPLYTPKMPKQQKISDRRSRSSNCSTLSVIAVVYHLDRILEVFGHRNFGMTLTLTFKVKVTSPHRDLSNKKKIIDLSHTVTEIHAFEVHTYYIGPMF